MKTFSRSILAFTLTLAAFVVISAAPASAQFTLNARYTGVVTDIEDTTGALTSISLGDAVDGVIRYNSFLPGISDGVTFEYDFPVTPGGGTLMTAHVGAVNLQSTQNLDVQTYINNPNSPADTSYGYTFQFNDGAAATNGYHLFGGALVGLVTTNPLLFSFPNPPSMLLPLAQYAKEADGFFFVDVYNANGGYIDTSFIGFQVTSVTNVPEPGSVALLVGITTTGVFTFRRRTRK